MVVFTVCRLFLISTKLEASKQGRKACELPAIEGLADRIVNIYISSGM